MTTTVNINKSIQAISVFLVNKICEDEKCTSREALIELLKTMTYKLLQDRDSKLYAESPEYVWSMLVDERKGDMESWRTT
jgi:hypothetical protein